MQRKGGRKKETQEDRSAFKTIQMIANTNICINTLIETLTHTQRYT